MIEEPYRWVEAIANRREYIETQLAAGSPIAAIGYRDGILFLTLGRARQKIFEIYDRIAMGAIGHPGDIERLRMAAIELASTEGFTRSAADVSLRRLAVLFAQPGFENGVRASVWRALSRPNAFCRSRREAGGGFVSARGIRRRDCQQRRDIGADAAGFWRAEWNREFHATDGIFS